MRIISGKFKGRIIRGFNTDGTRPTMDRVKESLFSMIQHNISDAIVLDLFAGSGSLGIEALSNGSNICYFVEINKKMLFILKENLKQLNIKEKYHIMNIDYSQALKHFKNNNIKFDIIFLDPPYNKHYINDALNKILKYGLLNSDGLVICEYTDEKINNDQFTTIKEKQYNHVKIKILQQNNN